MTFFLGSICVWMGQQAGKEAGVQAAKAAAKAAAQGPKFAVDPKGACSGVRPIAGHSIQDLTTPRK